MLKIADLYRQLKKRMDPNGEKLNAWDDMRKEGQEKRDKNRGKPKVSKGKEPPQRPYRF